MKTILQLLVSVNIRFHILHQSDVAQFVATDHNHIVDYLKNAATYGSKWKSFKYVLRLIKKI